MKLSSKIDNYLLKSHLKNQKPLWVSHWKCCFCLRCRAWKARGRASEGILLSSLSRHFQFSFLWVEQKVESDFQPKIIRYSIIKLRSRVQVKDKFIITNNWTEHWGKPENQMPPGPWAAILTPPLLLFPVLQHCNSQSAPCAKCHSRGRSKQRRSAVED